jgi:vacuolar iron transporter family protein
MDNSHFDGDSALEHLKKARLKGRNATKEQHVAETPDHLSAGADSAKETAIGALLVYLMLITLGITQVKVHCALFAIVIGWFVWKVGRACVIGWSRLERVNELIADEQYEIVNNREEEREELSEIYRSKGITGELLEQVIDVLMADDSRLLYVMLDEELGIHLENYDHPLKQAFGAAIGVFVSAVFLGLGLFIFPTWGLPAVSLIIVAFAAFMLAYIGQLNKLSSVVWNLAVAISSGLATFFLFRFILLQLLG